MLGTSHSRVGSYKLKQVNRGHTEILAFDRRDNDPDHGVRQVHLVLTRETKENISIGTVKIDTDLYRVSMRND